MNRRFLTILILVFGAAISADAQEKKIADFAGTLETGKVYRAAVRFDKDSLSFTTVKRLKLPAHHAGRIEWTNIGFLNGFYTLDAGEEIYFVFEVVARNVSTLAGGRLRTTFDCRILGMETKHKILGRNAFENFIFAGRCKKIRPTGKRHQSYFFTFEVVRIIAGTSEKREITFELYADFGGSYLLEQLDYDWDKDQCKAETEVEITLPRKMDEKPKK